jgi:hypothetical protein
MPLRYYDWVVHDHAHLAWCTSEYQERQARGDKTRSASGLPFETTSGTSPILYRGTDIRYLLRLYLSEVGSPETDDLDR